MEELLGIRPANAAEGILQDKRHKRVQMALHRGHVLAVGLDDARRIVAAALSYAFTAEKELGSVDTLLAEGRIGEITGWLREKIHRSPTEAFLSVITQPV